MFQVEITPASFVSGETGVRGTYRKGGGGTNTIWDYSCWANSPVIDQMNEGNFVKY